MTSACWRTTFGLCLLLVGCGDSGDDSDAGHDAGPVFDAGSDAKRNDVEPGQLCERLSTIQCAAEAYCCDAPGRTYAQCKKDMKTFCGEQLHLDELAGDPITGFDAERAAKAFTKFEQLASACDDHVATFGNSFEGLRGILQGSVAEGENCAPAGAAADPVVSGAALASCADPSKYACQPRGTQKDGKLNWTCDALSKVDGPCFSDSNCQDDLYCANPSHQLGAKCRPRKAEGKSCNYGNECTSLACKDNSCSPIDPQAAYCLDK